MTPSGSRKTRSSYNRVDLNEPPAPDLTTLTSTIMRNNNDSVAQPGQNDFESVMEDDAEADAGGNAQVPLPLPRPPTSSVPPTSLPESTMDTNTPLLHQQHQQNSTGDFAVIILDGLHRKFRVPASPEWSIAEFKNAGASIHHVAPPAQRLIYMGKMLQDGSTLKSYGIKTSETIVHLFPKPTMVITDSNLSLNEAASNGASVNGSSSNDNLDTDNQNIRESSGDGAHVPQIVVDVEEARRTSSMVIFTSSEMFEAQHRVKLFSFFLLFISTMELLTLLSIMLGTNTDPYLGLDDEFSPGDPTDSISGQGGDQTRSWRNSDYANLVISVFGFYVSTLGIRSTAENSVLSAKRYFYGLVIVGLSWIVNYYVMSIVAEKSREDDNDNENTDDGDPQKNLYLQALMASSLPICIWGICFMKAFQYQQLVRQAEMEAVERHGRFTRELERGNNNDDPDGNENGINVTYGGEDQNRNTNASSDDRDSRMSRLGQRNDSSDNFGPSVIDRSLI